MSGFRRFPFGFAISEAFGHKMRTQILCLFVVAFAFVGVLTTCRPNWFDKAGLNTDRGLSSWLDYSIEFHPMKGKTEASFVATLTNRSPYTLRIEVNDRKFHAGFTVKPDDQKEYKMFDREYRGLMLTSVWDEPKIVLGSGSSLSWSVPLSSLVREPEAPITEQSLLGSEVTSEMNITIEPRMPFGEFVEGNATKTSNTLYLSARESAKTK